VNAVLETKNLCCSFGALVVADRIDFRLERGARHALIGPNGAGKSTFVNLLAGGLRPNAGQIFLDGLDITSLSAAHRVKRGIGRTFQTNTLFHHLAVLDNVALAIAERLGVSGKLLRTARSHTEVIDEARALLRTLNLMTVEGTVVRNLPYGQQRLVEIAIALGLRPKVMILDEPAAGVPSHESHLIFDAIGQVPADISILFIEHDMDLVFRFASRITVLAMGAILMEGTPDQVRTDPRVREIYLGESRA
jgi:branched-chain amino acid transport system ATP-binding protein